VPIGLTIGELGRRAIGHRVVKFNALDLSRWLLQEGLAEIRDGRLVATPAEVEFGELLAG
jgi:hypothetical protein